MLPDPQSVIRRLLDRAERELIERMVEAGSLAAMAPATTIGSMRGWKGRRRSLASSGLPGVKWVIVRNVRSPTDCERS